MKRRLELKAVARAIGSPKSTMRGGLCQTKGLHGNRGGASQVGWPALSHSQPMPMSRPPVFLLITCDCRHGRNCTRTTTSYGN